MIARDRTAFLTRFPGASAKLAPGAFLNATALNNGGDRITLTDALGAIIRDFSYDDQFPWPVSPDGSGDSLVLIAPATNPDHSLPASWRSSTASGGSPGTGDAIAFTGSPTADTDGDGISALVEYAIGSSDSSPNSPGASADAAGTAVIADADGSIYFTATRNLAADDVILEPQMSTSLTGWSSAGFTLMAETPIGGGLSLMTWHSTIPAGGRVFARLNVRLR